MNQMTIAEWLVVAGLVTAFYLFVTSIPLARRLRRLRHEIQTDRIRNCWGEARVLMYNLARDGKISVRSATFQEFVRVQTFVLRRPDEYKAISRVLFDDLFRQPAAAPGWANEMSTWPHEMGEVLRIMTKGTYELLRSRRRGRLLFFVGSKLWRAIRLRKNLEAFIRKTVRRVPSLAADRRLFAAATRLENIHVT